MDMVTADNNGSDNSVPTVSAVTAHEGYRLYLEFDNGEQGWLDLSTLLDFGVFSRLRDPDRFREVQIVFDALEWPVGVDLDPEYVYRNTIREH